MPVIHPTIAQRCRLHTPFGYHLRRLEDLRDLVCTPGSQRSIYSSHGPILAMIEPRASVRRSLPKSTASWRKSAAGGPDSRMRNQRCAKHGVAWVPQAIYDPYLLPCCVLRSPAPTVAPALWQGICTWCHNVTPRRRNGGLWRSPGEELRKPAGRTASWYCTSTRGCSCSHDEFQRTKRE